MVLSTTARIDEIRSVSILVNHGDPPSVQERAQPMHILCHNELRNNKIAQSWNPQQGRRGTISVTTVNNAPVVRGWDRSVFTTK